MPNPTIETRSKAISRSSTAGSLYVSSPKLAPSSTTTRIAPPLLDLDNMMEQENLPDFTWTESLMQVPFLGRLETTNNTRHKFEVLSVHKDTEHFGVVRVKKEQEFEKRFRVVAVKKSPTSSLTTSPDSPGFNNNSATSSPLMTHPRHMVMTQSPSVLTPKNGSVSGISSAIAITPAAVATVSQSPLLTTKHQLDRKQVISKGVLRPPPASVLTSVSAASSNNPLTRHKSGNNRAKRAAAAADNPLWHDPIEMYAAILALLYAWLSIFFRPFFVGKK